MALPVLQKSAVIFDDEGTLGTDTTIIQRRNTGDRYRDLLSALRLGTTPTGNGKRGS